MVQFWQLHCTLYNTLYLISICNFDKTNISHSINNTGEVSVITDNAPSKLSGYDVIWSFYEIKAAWKPCLEQLLQLYFFRMAQSVQKDTELTLILMTELLRHHKGVLLEMSEHSF